MEEGLPSGTFSTADEALVDLMEEKPFPRITVADVIERAGIGRSTFYRHYQDVPSMAESMEVSESLVEVAFFSRSTSRACIPSTTATVV